MMRNNAAFTACYVVIWALFFSCIFMTKGYAQTPELTCFHGDKEHKLPWRVEAETVPAGMPSSSVQCVDDTIRIKAQRGLTLWLLQPLPARYTISFDREIYPGHGALRLSDMNMFWNAHEVYGALPQPRNGVFSAYDDLVLEYAGIGGNNNTTTRFRHYDGTGRRTLLLERKGPGSLLFAKHVYHVDIHVEGGKSTVLIDGHVYFSAPVTVDPPGYFGIRTVGSQQDITHFTLTR